MHIDPEIDAVVVPMSEAAAATSVGEPSPSLASEEGAYGPLAGMLTEALDLLHASFEDASAYAASLAMLGKYCANVLGSPAEERYRVIKKGNARFHSALGQYAAARAVLRAVGFVELSATFGQEATFNLPAPADLGKLALL